MEDDFYKVSSEKLFPKSGKMVAKFNKDKEAYEKEAPIISETIARLETQIAFYQSVKSIKTTDNAEKFMLEVNTNKKLVEILEREVNRLKGEVKKYSNEKK